MTQNLPPAPLALLGTAEKEDDEKLKPKNPECCAKELPPIPSCDLIMSTSIQSLHDGMAKKLGNFHKFEVPHRPTLEVKRELENMESCQKEPISRTELRCGFCPETFDYVSELMFHEQMHNGGNNFECQICGRPFQNGTNLKDHYNVHTNEHPYKCELCAKAFTQSSSLLTHKRTHVLVKTYKCDICGKLFKDASNFIKHKRFHSRPDQDLTNEEQGSHTLLPEKPYGCSYCEKAFKRTSDLKDHERVHTGERPYRCRICDKCFTQSSVLTGHMRIHTGEKPFHCVCGKTFNNSSNFKKHQRTHSVQDILAKVKMEDGISLSKQPLRIKNSMSNLNGMGAFFNKKDLGRMMLSDEDFKFLVEKKLPEESNEKLTLNELPPSVTTSSFKERQPFKMADTKAKPVMPFQNDVDLASECSILNGETTTFHANSEVNHKPKFSSSPTYECSNTISTKAEKSNYRPKVAQDLYVEISDSTDDECEEDDEDDDDDDDDGDVVGLAKCSFQSQVEDPKTKVEKNLKEIQTPKVAEESTQRDAENCQNDITEGDLPCSVSDMADQEDMLFERTMEYWESHIDDDDQDGCQYFEIEAKPYICFVCSKRFKRATDLKEHLRVHTGERPFVCQVCGKGFTQSSALSSHQRIHTGEKPFQCDVCYKRFNNSSNFSKHKRVHTGERPHNCPLCGKSFQEKRRVKRHLKAVHHILE